MLDIQHLTKTYGEKKAVDDLTLHIAPGEIYGFIGHNGAGKTTSLKAACGILDFTEGDILIDGINAIPGFSCKKSAGSFYAFANIKAFGKSAQEFAEELVVNAGVVTVPGSAFGACGEGYLRLVFANSDENLKEAVRRIDAYVRKTYPDIMK